METIQYTDTLRQGTDKINGNFNTVSMVTISAAESLDAAAFGRFHHVAGTSADYTIDLPTAVGNGGKTVIFKGIAALTKNITLAPVSGQLIDGEPNRKLNAGGSFTLMADGANWVIINEVGSWVDHTPVFSGFSVNPTILSSKYFRVGKMCTYELKFGASGTSQSTVTARTVTAPFSAANIGVQSGLITMLTNGSAQATPGVVNTRVSSNVLDAYINSTLGAWSSSSGNCGFSFTLTYHVA